MLVTDADKMYSAIETAGEQTIWVDGLYESSALDEGRIGTGQGESNLEEHSMASGKYGVTSGDFTAVTTITGSSRWCIDPGGRHLG